MLTTAGNQEREARGGDGLRQTSRGARNLRFWETPPDSALSTAPAIPTCGLAGNWEAPRGEAAAPRTPTSSLPIFRSGSHVTLFPTGRLVTPMH